MIKATARHAEDLERLLMISGEFVKTTELKELYRKIITISKDFLHLDYSTVMILSEDGTCLIPKDTIGFPPSVLNTCSLREGEGLASYVLRSGAPERVVDLSKETRFAIPKEVLKQRIASALCVPMMLEGKIFGVLVGHTVSRREFTDEEISLYQLIGNQAAVAIKNAMHVAALKENEQYLKTILDSIQTGVLVIDAETHRIVAANPAAINMIGAPCDQILGRICHQFICPAEEGACPLTDFGQPIDNSERLLINAGRNPVPILKNAGTVQMNGRTYLIESLIDISERKQMEETIWRQAYHDDLTGLPNRILFIDHLTLALTQAHRSRQKLAVMFLDLDRFKMINDALGHSVGDRLLQKVAHRLRASLREEDTVARMGGDEYTVLLPHIAHENDVVTIAKKILAAFEQSFLIDGHEFSVTTSVGISLYPDDGSDIETLLKNADVAMYHAKEQAGNNYQFYSPSLNSRALKRITIERRLRQVFEREELVVYYQPQVSAATRQIVCAEALVRWQHPEQGLLSPVQFIPLAEETGLIDRIDEWVLRTACAQSRTWQEHGGTPFVITVNLSARQFQHSNLADIVSRVLRETGLSPELLELEITESVAMKNMELTVANLTKLTGMGVKVSIDDFGTGYSSLSYLKKLPIQKLKIDKTFITGLGEDPDDNAIVSAIIALAHNLKLNVAAEGVETEDQLSFLQSYGCDVLQGYLFSEPLPVKRFGKLIEARE
ncbi:MAG: EAL domain-containing protein [Nitrospirota bacterium]